MTESIEMVGAAWDEMDELLPDSYYKVHPPPLAHSQVTACGSVRLPRTQALTAPPRRCRWCCERSRGTCWSAIIDALCPALATSAIQSRGETVLTDLYNNILIIE